MKTQTISEHLQTIIHNITDRKCTGVSDNGAFEFQEHDNIIDSIDTMGESAWFLQLLLRVLKFYGWEIDPKTDTDCDTMTYLRKDDYILKVSVDRYGLYCHFFN